MPRRGPAPRRDLVPDPVYDSTLVTQVINKVLQRGKRTVAERIVYDALEIIEQKTGSEPLTVLKRAVDNSRPQLEVKSRRVGGATYQVPVEVRPRRATTLAIRWIVGFARERRERTMAERLANELLDASNNTGSSAKRKDDGTVVEKQMLKASDGTVWEGVTTRVADGSTYAVNWKSMDGSVSVDSKSVREGKKIVEITVGEDNYGPFRDKIYYTDISKSGYSVWLDRTYTESGTEIEGLYRAWFTRKK